MPKKFKGENSKAVESRARKASQKADEANLKAQALEDERWKDDDKHAKRKQERQQEKDRKKVEQAENKKEKQRLLDEEMAAIKSAKPEPSAKVTRMEIEANKQRLAQEAAAEQKSKKQSRLNEEEMPLEENLNQLQEEGEEARTVEDAISVLSVADQELEKHPEKRMKAAFQAFEDVRLPILKAENKNLRLSQIKQLVKKEWMKSPDNPLNQRAMAYNAKRK